ncbi:MAG: glutamine synthetase III [Spirochaetota bacterium]|nr:glutamine synthetase III [Spirochaetota bacterium]
MNATDFTKTPVREIYGINSFGDAVMRERLPKSIYKELKSVQNGSNRLSTEVAEVVANAMKDWALEKGATHYTHWFQPLTGLTAEKHDSFISPTDDGRVIMEFSGKELIQGEPDASSFPSGGLRATFEARGYTAWDTASPAFLKEDNSGGVTLCIPTAFISYTGEALDMKVPLLRSMEAVNKQALRVLKILGMDVEKITISVGPEQEYFLVDKEFYDKRPDLMLTGRTVIGSKPSKGQEMDDHYFGAIKARASAFMSELNLELWKLGIASKTQHNEVAPNQFEIAPIYDTCNVATDRNQLLMETLKKIAARHDLVALLHEKPFAGVNGSGKHNNWSISTDTGINLLEPGDNPIKNSHFILFLVAILKAVDKYAPLLRMSAASAGNDHRLGANEAPPAIISIFLGDQLTQILESLSGGKKYTNGDTKTIELGVSTLPKLPKDMTDRNRTSPFAFTGNKFEFRMVPSSISIANANTVLNTAVADVLAEFADKLETATNPKETLKELVANTYTKHKRVVYNGNNYSEEWVKEAESRGLTNITNTVDALNEIAKDYSVELFERQNVLSRQELESRCEIDLETYSKQINIEASIMIELTKKQVFPSAGKYITQLSSTISGLKESGISNNQAYTKMLKTVSEHTRLLYENINTLETLLSEALSINTGAMDQAIAYRKNIFTQMAKVRVEADTLETLIPCELWPIPTYLDLLFRL